MIEGSGGLEDAGVEHVGRVVDILDEGVGGGPFDEDPAFQVFEQAGFIFEGLEIVEQLHDTWLEGVDQGAVATAGEVFFQLDDEPHGPVGDKDAVVVVGGVAHGQHAGGQELEGFGQEVAFELVFFDGGVAGEVECDAGGEEAVAEPAGPFAGGAVHKDVGGVLAEGGDGGVEDGVEFGIAAGELSGVGLVVGQFAQGDVADGGGAGADHDFEGFEGVGFEGFELIAAGGEFVADGVDAAEPPEVDVVAGEDFIEGEVEAGGFGAADVQAGESGQVGAEVQDGELAGFEWQRVGLPGLVEWFEAGGFGFLQFVRGDDDQLVLGVAFEGGADIDQGPVFPEIVDRQVLFEGAAGVELAWSEDGIAMVADAAGQEVGRGLDGAGDGFDGGVWIGAPGVGAGSEAVVFDKGALEAVALDFLEVLGQEQGREGMGGGAGGGEGLVAGGDFGLEEGGLIEQVVAVDVVAGDFDGDQVGGLEPGSGELVAVDAVIAVRPARGAFGEEFAVEEDAVAGGAAEGEPGVFGRAVEGGAEADKEVHFGFAAGGPDGPGGLEGGFRGGWGLAERGGGEAKGG